MKSKRTQTVERLARRWPKDDPEECREAFWALSGMLLRADWDPEDVAKLVTDLAMLTGHRELTAGKHAADVELTIERLDGDEPTLGAPTLAGLIGWDAVNWIKNGLVRNYSPPSNEGEREMIKWPTMQTEMLQ